MKNVKKNFVEKGAKFKMKQIVLNKEVSVRYKTDIAVVGGGVAGCGAAIAAAREGKKVLLIEQSGCLGGLATNGHVSPFDATNDRSGRPFGGIAQEIIEGMEKAQKAYGVPTSVIKREGPHLFKWVLLNMAVDAGVDILFHATLIEPVMNNDTIDYLIISTKSGLEAVQAKVYVDASGDGDLFAGAGEEFIIGSEQNSLDILKENNLDRMHFEEGAEGIIREEHKVKCDVQPVSIMFTMGNVDLDKKPSQYNNRLLKFEDLGIDKEEFKKLPYWGTPGFEENGDLIPLPQGRILISRTGRPNEILVNISRILGVNATDAVELTNAEIKAQKQVMYLVDFLKRYVPGFEDSFLVESGNVLGVRESRRLIGQYVLSGDDAIRCRQFEDNIACGSYMIDIHDPQGRRKALGGEIDGNCYGIPYGSICPKRVTNLLACGRCISVDHVAHASTRIQGTCVMTGQAAGTAAAQALLDNVSVQELDVKAVVNRLMKNGVYLGKDE